jgi:hypothetical protein
MSQYHFNNVISSYINKWCVKSETVDTVTPSTWLIWPLSEQYISSRMTAYCVSGCSLWDWANVTERWQNRGRSLPGGCHWWAVLCPACSPLCVRVHAPGCGFVCGCVSVCVNCWSSYSPDDKITSTWQHILQENRHLPSINPWLPHMIDS